MEPKVDLEKTIVFAARLRPLSAKKEEVSCASVMRSAQTLLPEEFDTEGNSDLMPVVFDLGVINEFNQNHDGVDTETAISFVKNFSHKPINLEHVKPNIVGHIVNASITETPFEYKDNDLSSFAGRTDKLYITAVGVVYKHVFKELADAITDEFQSTDFDPYKNNLVLSASWELAFSNYIIAKGAKTLSECSLMEDDESKSMKKMLPSQGGTGFDAEDRRVNRLIKMPVIPLGAAFTFTPAADVEGVYTVEEDKADDDSKSSLNNLIEKNSPNSKNNVSIENVLDMEPNELTAKIEEAVASALQQSDASSARSVITKVIEEHAKSWKSDIEKEEQAKAAVQKDLDAVKEQLATASKELETLKSESLVKETIDKFNERMNVINDTYNFSDTENKFIVSEVKDLPLTDEAFASYQEKLAVVFSHKSKEEETKLADKRKADIEEAVAARLKEKGIEVETEVEKTAEEIATEEAKANISNNNQEKETKSLYEQFVGSFEIEIN
jgi:hypothetical protein